MSAAIAVDETQFTYKPFPNTYFERSVPRGAIRHGDLVPLNIVFNRVQAPQANEEVDDVTARARKMLDLIKRIGEIAATEPEDDFIYAPSESVMALAVAQLALGYALGPSEIPRALVSADGTGGLVFEWRLNPKEIKLVIPGGGDRISYIYHQNENRYGVIEDLRDNSLAEWLTWLTR